MLWSLGITSTGSLVIFNLEVTNMKDLIKKWYCPDTVPPRTGSACFISMYGGNVALAYMDVNGNWRPWGVHGCDSQEGKMTLWDERITFWAPAGALLDVIRLGE